MSSGEPITVLERVDHAVTAGSGDTAMKERRAEVELLADVLDEEFAHLPELGEHEGPFALVEQLGHELVEPGQLARAAGEP